MFNFKKQIAVDVWSNGDGGKALCSPAFLSNIVVTHVIEAHRAVPLSYARHVCGRHPVRPGHGSIVFESLLERDVISALAQFPELICLKSQPLTVFYRANDKPYRYTPDLLVELSEVPPELECLGFELKTIIECKPSDRIKEQAVKMDRDFRAVKQADLGGVVLITDDDLQAGRMEVRYGR